MIIGVDHILIAVTSVEQAIEVYRRLGFQVMAGGEHPHMGTYNALAPLSDGAYLELIGVRDRNKAERFPNSRQVVRALARENRLATFVLASNDLASDVQALRARGLAIGDPLPGERLRPDGQKVMWRTAHFEDPNLPFLIQDLTPHHVRVPEPTQGLGQHAWLSQVQVLAQNVADASRVWKDVLGVIPPQDDEFKLERCVIRLAPNHDKPTGIDALSLATGDFDNAAQMLRAAGVSRNARDNRIELDSHATAGAELALVKATDYN